MKSEEVEINTGSRQRDSLSSTVFNNVPNHQKIKIVKADYKVPASIKYCLITNLFSREQRWPTSTIQEGNNFLRIQHHDLSEKNSSSNSESVSNISTNISTKLN